MKIDKAKKPPPTAADTPSSGYYGADEDDVMNNIFNHYAVPVTNALDKVPDKKFLPRMEHRRPALKSSLSPSKSPRPRWSSTWPSSSQEPGLNMILITQEKLISQNLTPS